MQKLSQKLWQQIKPIYQKIVDHPFNQEMMNGTLHQKKFQYYIAQDITYLNDFTKALSIIASKIDSQYVGTFMRYVENVVAAEKEIVRGFLCDNESQNNHGGETKKTLANIGYTSYIIRTCIEENAAVGVATILPCFWIYSELGKQMLPCLKLGHQYAGWIQTYADDQFASDVRDAIHICDKLGDDSDSATIAKMQQAFYTSACFEWHFWNDAYHMLGIDELNMNK